MGYDDRREILDRLEALERLVRSLHDDRGGGRREHRGGHDREGRDRDCGDHHHHRDDHDHDGGNDRGRGDFEERRIIDTIVQLVTEQVSRLLDDRQERSRQSGDGGDEKRLVDLVVSLVSEHVQEIVATELDRRLGRPAAPGAGAPPPPPPAEPEQP
jgi:hypothetical protein